MDRKAEGRVIVDIDSIKWMPPGKYKLILNITSISKEFSIKCDLLLRKHIPFCEFSGAIAINKFMSIFFFFLGGILAILMLRPLKLET